MGNVFEHGESEHIDGFKVTLTGLGPTAKIDPKGAKWIGTWQGPIKRTKAGGGGSGGEQELTLIQRADGSELWLHGGEPLFEAKIEIGKITYMTQGGELGPPCPCYETFERRGDLIVGYGGPRQVQDYTYELSPLPKPEWLTPEFLTSTLEMYESDWRRSRNGSQ